MNWNFNKMDPSEKPDGRPVLRFLSQQTTIDIDGKPFTLHCGKGRECHITDDFAKKVIWRGLLPEDPEIPWGMECALFIAEQLNIGM